MNLPNKLTIARIFLVPFFILCFYFIQRPYISAVIFSIAALTDLLDGYLARKNNQITIFGKFIDPLADKILVLSALTIFVEQGVLPAWPVIIILFREFAVSGLRLMAATNGKTMAAGKSGKWKTVTQLVGIIFVLAFYHQSAHWIFTTGLYFIYLSVFLTIFSFGIYVFENKEVFQSDV